MIKLMRDDGADLVILEKEEMDLLIKGELVMFPTLVLTITNDMDHLISRIKDIDKLPGEQIFEIIKESQKREYSKSVGYACEKQGMTAPVTFNPKGYDA